MVRKRLKELKPCLIHEAMRLISSGAIDVATADEGTSKAVIHVVLLNYADTTRPFCEDLKDEVKNLRKF